MKEKFSEETFDRLDFDSRDLLDAVERLDVVRGIICDPDALRKELMHLHQRAMNLTYHGDMDIPSGDEPIAELAEEIEYSIDDCIEKFERILTLIKPLTELQTDPDDNYEEDDDYEDG